MNLSLKMCMSTAQMGGWKAELLIFEIQTLNVLKKSNTCIKKKKAIPNSKYEINVFVNINDLFFVDP